MNNRLKQAWLALCGKLEPEVLVVRVPVVGEPHIVHLYKVWRVLDPSLYFTSCEQAMEKYGATEKVQAICVGGEYFVGNLERVVPQPKPKVAKGKRRNGE